MDWETINTSLFVIYKSYHDFLNKRKPVFPLLGRPFLNLLSLLFSSGLSPIFLYLCGMPNPRHNTPAEVSPPRKTRIILITSCVFHMSIQSGMRCAFSATAAHCWVLFSAQLSPWLLFCSIAALPVISYFTLEFSFLSRTLIYWFCLYQSNSSKCQDHFCLSSCPLGSLRVLSAWLYQQILCVFSIASSKVLQVVLNEPHAWKTPRGALVMLSEFDSKLQFTVEMLQLPGSKTHQ